MLHPLTPVTHSNFISTAKAVSVLSCLDLIYSYGHTAALRHSILTGSAVLPPCFRKPVTPKRNRQYGNNVSLFLALIVRYIVTHTHTHTHNFLACSFLAVHGVPSSWLLCSITTQRHVQSVKQPQYQLLTTSGCTEGCSSGVVWHPGLT